MKHRRPRWAAWPRNRRLNLAAWLIAAACLTLTTFAAVEIADQLKSDVEKQPSIESKFDYLTNVLAVEQAKIDAATARKAEALKLLGQTAATTTNTAIVSNVVETLVSNITFVGKFPGYWPAVDALAVVGEPAVPRLLKVIEDSAETPTVSAAAEALARIKRFGYYAFLKAQKDKMSPQGWHKLSTATVVID